MAPSYTPIQLPNYAPAEVLPAPLPSIEEIEAMAKEQLEKAMPAYLIIAQSNGDDVEEERKFYTDLHDDDTRIYTEDFVINYGRDSSLVVEAENMLFVAANSDIRAPTVYAVFEHGDKICLIYEIVKGTVPIPTYSVRARVTTGADDDDTAAKFRDLFRKTIEKLQAIPTFGYYGSLGRKPFPRAYIGAMREGMTEAFDTIDEFNAAFSRRCDCCEETDDVETAAAATATTTRQQLLEELFAVAGRNTEHTKPVFTHTRLLASASYLEATDELCINGWDSACFMPAYMEYANAGTDTGRCLDARFDEEARLIGEIRKVSCARVHF